MTLERTRPATTLRPIGGAGFDDSAPDPDAQMARVSAGVYQETMPVAGMTVGEIRRRHGQRLDIPPGAVAFLGGAPVGDDTVVRPGQSLSFIRHAGSKGVKCIKPSARGHIVCQANGAGVACLIHRAH